MSQQNNGAAPAAENKQVATQKKFQEETVNAVLQRVQAFQANGELILPPAYSAENALKSAWLILQGVVDRNDKPVLEICTRASIANALLEMVTKGLNPVKKQCYFIAYGNELSCDESYLGTIAIAKREGDVKDVNANCIYEGDVFEFEIDPKTARKIVLQHKQGFDNIAMDKIKGAYAVVEYNDGTFKTEVMTIAQIRQAWMQGPMKGNSPAHKNFPDQMSMKTVISRAVKIDIGSSDDSHLLQPDHVSTGVKTKIREEANKTSIGFDQPVQEATVVSAKMNEPVNTGAAPVEEEEGPGY